MEKLFYFLKMVYRHHISNVGNSCFFCPVHSNLWEFCYWHNYQQSNVLLHFIVVNSNRGPCGLDWIQVGLRNNMIGKLVMKHLFEILEWCHFWFWWERKRLTLVGGVVLHCFPFTQMQRLVAFTCIFCTTSYHYFALYLLRQNLLRLHFMFHWNNHFLHFLPLQTLHSPHHFHWDLSLLGDMSSFMLGPGPCTIKWSRWYRNHCLWWETNWT